MRGGIFALPALRHGHSGATLGRGRYSGVLPGPASAPAKTPLFTPVSRRPGAPRPLAGGPRLWGGGASSGTLGLAGAEVLPRHKEFLVKKRLLVLHADPATLLLVTRLEIFIYFPH